MEETAIESKRKLSVLKLEKRKKQKVDNAGLFMSIFGNRDLLGIIAAFDCPYTGDIICHDGLYWVLINRGVCDLYITKSGMDWAARKGHLDIIKWLHKNRTEGCTQAAMDWAAKNGHGDIVRWLHENRTEGCSCSLYELCSSNWKS